MKIGEFQTLQLSQKTIKFDSRISQNVNIKPKAMVTVSFEVYDVDDYVIGMFLGNSRCKLMTQMVILSLDAYS